MARTKRPNNSDADLIEAVRSHRSRILEFYNQAANKKPVILLDHQRMRLHRYTFDQYRMMVREGSQAVLHKRYEKAIKEQGARRRLGQGDARLVTMNFRRD